MKSSGLRHWRGWALSHFPARSPVLRRELRQMCASAWSGEARQCASSAELNQTAASHSSIGLVRPGRSPDGPALWPYTPATAPSSSMAASSCGPAPAPSLASASARASALAEEQETPETCFSGTASLRKRERNTQMTHRGWFVENQRPESANLSREVVLVHIGRYTNKVSKACGGFIASDRLRQYPDPRHHGGFRVDRNFLRSFCARKVC